MTISNYPSLKVQNKDQENLKEWLEHDASLTDKLQAIKGNIQLIVLLQEWTHADWWDLYMLQIEQAPVYKREILMSSDSVNYWYAKTIIPKKCFDLNPDFFKRLEHESIRNLIFDEPNVSRINMINYSIDKQSIEYYWVKKVFKLCHETLWVRLAEFSLLQTESFFVIEILFPELENLK
ncbi:MAG: chorismate lyase [bacterium]|nr:chorismate lyase [bacterium]